MKTIRIAAVLSGLLLTSIVAFAQTQFSSWPFFIEATTNSNPGFYKLTVPLHVMGQAREDLGDLRLFDSENREIPYAIWIHREIQEQKEFMTTWNVTVPAYQLNRNQGAHASSWTIDLGARVPCDRLSLGISDSSFYRPFQVEAVDDPQNPELLASGTLSRRANEADKKEEIIFDREVYAKNLRIQITDYSNPVLSIEAIQASAPTRELVFELKQTSLPLRLYYGNAKIDPPHYDFEKELGTSLKTTPQSASVSQANKNESFVPEPLPFTERLPWLIYLVLAASSVALGWILLSLARKAVRFQEVKE